MITCSLSLSVDSSSRATLQFGAWADLPDGEGEVSKVTMHFRKITGYQRVTSVFPDCRKGCNMLSLYWTVEYPTA